MGTKSNILSTTNRPNRCGMLHNGISKIKSKNIINKVKNMLETNITKTPNFVRTSLSSMKNSALKIFH